MREGIFEPHVLADGRTFFTGQLPGDQLFRGDYFERLWNLHPLEFREITMIGRRVPLPRWQQAYGRNYRYRGEITPAIPVPEMLQPLLEFVRSTVAVELNGMLVNWYDAALGHYIGAHRDSTDELVAEVPIVVCSFGAERTFRLKKWRGRECHDFRAFCGRMFVLPRQTNDAWTHEIPKVKASERTGRRISVTIRAFQPESEEVGLAEV